jgi:hypothetical protein
MMRRLLPALIFLAGMLLASIVYWFLLHRPEASINWNPPQKEAAILLSDPQLYSREALINDRRQETEFFRTMLKASSKTADSSVEFRPQLQQAIETARTIHAQMNLPDIIAPLTQNKATAGDGQQETGPPAPESGTRGTDAPDPHNTGTRPDKNASGTREAEKRGQWDASLDDPRERFLDLQSYRADIRAALAAVNLDDRHDYGGQALYRLQFRATVLPGQNPAKFGVAEMRIRPPNLEDEDYRRIYMAWLGYATKRLNDPQQKGSIDTDPRYEALSQGSEVIKVLNICRDQKDCTLYLALPPQGAKSVVKFLESYLNMQKDIEQVTGGTPELDDSIQASEEPETTPDPCEQEADNQNRSPSLLKYYSNAKQVYTIMPYIATSLAILKSYQNDAKAAQQTQQRYQGTSKKSQQAQEPPSNSLSESDSYSNYFKTVDTLSSADSFLLNYFSILERQFPQACDKKKVMLSVTTKRKNTPAPQQFIKELKALLGEQKPYVYAMTPTALMQRVSNVHSAVTTLDIALKLANPKVGAGGGEEVKRTLEAIERFPRIVGFADREPDTPSASFGWVFGPRLQSNNTLDHPVADYNVAVDVAIPGWWPKIELELRTIWVANWHNTRHVLQDTSPPLLTPRKVTVPMPLLTPPDLESLTEVLTGKLIGPWGHPPPPASVIHVNPTAVSACMNEVTFVIEGDNLWRDPEVYWEGVRAENVTLLPGMRGITASFTIKKLFDAEQVDRQRQQFRRTSLLIALRNSKSQVHLIDFYGHRLGENQKQCEGPVVSAQTYIPNAPTIHKVAPSTIYACSISQSPQFLISGKNLGSFDPKQRKATSGHVLFGATKGTPKLLDENDPVIASIVVSFPDLQLPSITSESKIPLTVATPVGLDSKDVAILPCK